MAAQLDSARSGTESWLVQIVVLDEQGCYGLQKKLTICKFPDTISKFLQTESCLQNCKSTVLQMTYLDGT
jgi:hypothetical protein